MKQMIVNIRSFCSLLLVLLIALSGMNSCVSEEFPQGPQQPLPSEGYMKLKIQMPDYNMPRVDDKTSTKAMDDRAESAIKTDQLQVLVFKENDDTTFYYKAPVVNGSLQVNATDPSKATVTIKMVKSVENETFTLLVIANRHLSDITLTEGVTRKEDVLQSQKFLMPTGTGKWNAATYDPTPFPMWGEITGVKVTEQEMIAPELTLHRALARIDVGVGFNIVDGVITDQAEGLPYFKLTQVNVYRTFNSGHVTPSVSNPKPGQPGYTPFVPSDAQRRGDDSPLTYGPFAQTDAFVREIYVPEATLPATPTNGNMHCIVVGGEYNGVTSYYRLDFAEDDDTDTRNYKPILRNHRYIFNILNVNGEGFTTPEEALKSTPKNSLDYELIIWDETIHEMHVHGKYYFGLDNREITLEAIKTAEQATNFFDIKYQTNYPIADSDGIYFEWENPVDPSQPAISSLFKAEWIEEGSKGTIRIVALTNNETNTILSDILHVRLGSFRIKVLVNQKYINYKYSLDCSSVKVFGTYRPGYALNPLVSTPAEHRIELTFVAEDESILGSKYEIATESKNGIVFTASGVITSLTQAVQLIGQGTLETPMDERLDPFTVKIISNSSSGSYCEATITPVMPKLRVLTIANNSDHGYDIAKVGKGSNKVVSSPNNFGPNDNSIVKIEGFEFVRGYLNYTSLGTTVTNWLRDGADVVDEDGVTRKYLADILYVGHDGLYEINANDAKVIVDYMKNGGVVMMFNEGTIGSLNVVKQLFPEATASTASFIGYTVPFVGNPVYKTGTDEEWIQYQLKLMNDPILNGPFGDLREKQWGEDASSTVVIKSDVLFNNEDIMIYSYGENLANAKPGIKDGACAFKYETALNSNNLVSFVYFGDGGFVSSAVTGNPYDESGYTLCPFWWNTTTFFPIPKPNYGAINERADVYNSQAFCNILAWAINRSADLFHKREAAMGR